MENVIILIPITFGMNEQVKEQPEPELVGIDRTERTGEVKPIRV